eukprot:TRINITY_DN6333_c0_g1_i1.p1 TRINITY_DN6333_c0_g1~~TRINITY_DN6333_c0_g1_i1.p1  ORF type:complete len:522 (-),score=77.27 TRINITY_DN6333_c0_g1_i1:23-1588(-)
MGDETKSLFGSREADEPPAGPPLSRWLKLSYSIGEIGIWSASLIVGCYLNPFFLEVAGLDAILTGNILLIGQIWDAISNPIIGKLTDSINTRWGRRRPWLVICAIPFGLTFFGTFMVWDTGSQTSKFWYYLVIVILFNTFGNAINTPYTALTTELASSYDESTELTQGRMLANIVAGVAISFGHSALVETWKVQGPNGPTELTDYKKGYFVSALLFGLIFMIPPLQAAFFIKERPFKEVEEPEEKKPKGCWGNFVAILSIWKNVFLTLRNRAYLVITIVFLLAWTTVQFVQNNLVLYCKYVLKQESQFEWFMLILQLTAALSLFAWSLLARKIGKQKVYWIGIGIWIAVQIPMSFYNEGTPFWVMYINSVVAGMGVSVAFLIPWSLIPDIIDSDELQTGQRREGVFYSLFVLFQKIGAATALSVSSYVLGLTGYVTPSRETTSEQIADVQPPSVIMALRIMTGPVPAVMLFISLLVSWFYPLDKELVLEMQGELRERRRLIAKAEVELGESETEKKNDTVY